MLINAVVSSRFRSDIVHCKYIWRASVARQVIERTRSVNFIAIRRANELYDHKFWPNSNRGAIWKSVPSFFRRVMTKVCSAIRRIAEKHHSRHWKRTLYLNQEREKSGIRKDLNPTKNARRIGRKMESRRIYSIYHRLKQLDDLVPDDLRIIKSWIWRKRKEILIIINRPAKKNSANIIEAVCQTIPSMN